MYRLSIEEMGFLIGYLGEYPAAAGYLTSLIGQQSAENMSGRVTAASHGLVAWGLLRVGATPEDASVEPQLDALVRKMADTPRSFQAERLQDGKASQLTIFLGDGMSISHEISDEVVVNLGDATGGEVDEILTHLCLASSTINTTNGNQNGDAMGELALDELGELRRGAGSNRDGLLKLLSPVVSKKIAEEMVGDMEAEGAVWGSVILLETADGSAETPLESNAGVFTLSTKERAWFFEADESGTAKIYHGSAEKMKQLIDIMR